MKEKYIFFTLLIIALVMLIGAGLGRKAKGEISAEQKQLEKKLKQAAQKQPLLPEKIDMARIENAISFSRYEGLLQRSPFLKAQPKVSEITKTTLESLPAPVEEKTPLFMYKGKIASGKRLVVIIAQTRTGEVFMVSKGESIDDYKVLDITDTEVILSKKGEADIILETVERPGVR